MQPGNFCLIWRNWWMTHWPSVASLSVWQINFLGKVTRVDANITKSSLAPRSLDFFYLLFLLLLFLNFERLNFYLNECKGFKRLLLKKKLQTSKVCKHFWGQYRQIMIRLKCVFSLFVCFLIYTLQFSFWYSLNIAAYGRKSFKRFLFQHHQAKDIFAPGHSIVKR